ncbi:MAG: hypothetical protein WEA29_01365 [Acidimicrobiia bacterium]
MSGHPKVRYSLDSETSTFTIDGYNRAPAFSNFLPGIAGPIGIPAWTYWVNRGQAIMGLGVGDRDNQILEFYSFNKACLRVESEGFRTFVRVDDGPIWEPFRRVDDPAVSQRLDMNPSGLCLVDENPAVGLRCEVRYFELTGHRTAGLVRHVTLTDLTGRTRNVDWIDGVPRILPKGIDQHGIKRSARHIEAMIEVVRHEDVPLFRLRQSASDDADIGAVQAGNVYLVTPRTEVVTDPLVVFGDRFSLGPAARFAAGGAAAVLGGNQATRGITPCALAVHRGTLDGAGSMQATSFIGRAEELGHLTDLREDMDTAGFADRAEQVARRAVDAVADHAFTVSAVPELDAYVRQTFLDNVLRGGLPVTIDADPPQRINLYWRQNADLERDYHDFVLEPTYLSQGMGHYRNVLQNRRNDPWFAGLSDQGDIDLLIGLIQLDGYNPLEVRHTAFHVDAEVATRWLADHGVDEGGRQSVAGIVSGGPVTPGRLLMSLDDVGIDVAATWTSILADLLPASTPAEPGGREAGFWIDHWHYNLDLLDGYLAVFPDHLERLLLDRRHTYYDNPDVVLPRARRVVARDGRLRQLRSVALDAAKAAMIDARVSDSYRARDHHGAGKVIRSTLLEKLLLLAATRLASIDMGGRGIDMEAGKPGWNDSLNGLPGLFGSGLSELVELHRLLTTLRDWLGDVTLPPDGIELFTEIAAFVESLSALVDEVDEPLEFWVRANGLKERYRSAVMLGVDGARRFLPPDRMADFLERAIARVRSALGGEHGEIAAAGVPHTYFVNEVTAWTETDDGPQPTSVEARPMGLFLEGAVHWLREFPEDAATMYAAVRSSALYDKPLGMYRISTPGRPEDAEAGRAVAAYPPGWLENGSVYTHMEYKYLLEVLRSGLHREFWDDARHALIPFLDPATYGRSPLEGVSFIVSSLHPDPAEHGRGYQPRLSGVTAEFLHIWMLATVGRRPFRLVEGSLRFGVEPALPGDLFTTEAITRRVTSRDGSISTVKFPAGVVATRILGDVFLVLSNPGRADTYGKGAARVAGYRLDHRDGSTTEIDGPEVGAPHAEAVRRRSVHTVTARLV